MRANKVSIILLIIALFNLDGLMAQTPERVWGDTSGLYQVTASLVTSDNKSVVLRKSDGELVILRRDQLSPADQKHLGTEAGSTTENPLDSPTSTTATKPDLLDAKSDAASKISLWKLRQGGEIGGTLMGFGNQRFIAQRRKSEIFINDVELSKLPEAYELILPTVISTVDKRPIESLSQLEKHLAKAGGGPFEYIVSGVQLGLAAGGSITVPLEMLTLSEAELVAPGFARWQAARLEGVSEDDRYATESRENLMLNSYDQLRAGGGTAAQKMKQMELGLLSVNAGITDVWEVTLIPNTPYGYARSVVVPGRDSGTAQQLALQKFPGWQLGTVRKLRN